MTPPARVLQPLTSVSLAGSPLLPPHTGAADAVARSSLHEAVDQVEGAQGRRRLGIPTESASEQLVDPAGTVGAGERAVDQQAEVIIAPGQRQRVRLEGELLVRQLERAGGAFLRQENQDRLIAEIRSDLA